MSAFVAWFARTRIGRWCITLAALIAAGVATYLAGRAKGKRAAGDAQAIRDAKDLADAVARARADQHTAQEIRNETAKLPDAPPQRVADADPATAAGRLRDDGWVRPRGT